MIKVSIEVRKGTARFDVAVTAQNIERALALVGRTYPARGAVGVKFLIEPEEFFVGAPARERRAAPPEKLAA